MIGALVVLIRVVNPAYPEAMMLVILFMNVMAPVIDYVLVQGQHHAERQAPCRNLSRPATRSLFATAVCVVCALLVAVAAVGLRERQEVNAQLYQQKNVLLAAGLLKPGADGVARSEVLAIFDERIRVRAGRPRDRRARARRQGRRRGLRPAQGAQRPGDSRAPRRRTTRGSARLPKRGVVYFSHEAATARSSRWCCRSRAWACGARSTASSSLDRDGNTVRGLTFYDQKETPGLGGEIGNPKWQALWRGRKAFDDQLGRRSSP